MSRPQTDTETIIWWPNLGTKGTKVAKRAVNTSAFDNGSAFQI